MRYSQLFGKTRKSAPADADSVNARLLQQGGFIDQLMAGAYSFLPLGHRVHEKIKNIIREEMNMIGSQEVFMPALHPKENWEKTGRWENPGQEVMFRVEGRDKKQYGLGWTHEEIVTPLAKRFINSYKDLPLAVYQIQTKFRNEPRAKSGLLRGREFSMKDLYSFHATPEDLEDYFGTVMQAYQKIFKRCGLNAYVVEASGGAFSKYSHEFQVPTEYGEDLFYACSACDRNQNKEIVESSKCPDCGGERVETKAIEVGNIFKLGTRFTEAFDVTYTDDTGKKQPAIMGCYGMGPSRVMGTIVEVSHDEHGMVWPDEVAPYRAHLIKVNSKNNDVKNLAEEIYKALLDNHVEVLFDDREGARAGEQFADADLIGCPVRLVVSEKSIERGGVEWKMRNSEESAVLSQKEFIHKLI
ncbi:MAG: aminoacyl--tRNA ligase-related protein [bacterium]|nr:aminoacyl--tRNA ligase-related protein [bacterium]